MDKRLQSHALSNLLNHAKRRTARSGIGSELSQTGLQVGQSVPLYLLLQISDRQTPRYPRWLAELAEGMLDFAVLQRVERYDRQSTANRQGAEALL